jgi:rhodanese-related sulfurtransferase
VVHEITVPDNNQPAQDCREHDPRDCYTRIIGKKPGDCILIDVRTAREYAGSRIAGAINIDFFSPSFRSQVEYLDPHTPCIVYCQKGNRGKKAMELREAGGFLAVYNISGGITGWKEAGLPVES